MTIKTHEDILHEMFNQPKTQDWYKPVLQAMQQAVDQARSWTPIDQENIPEQPVLWKDDSGEIGYGYLVRGIFGGVLHTPGEPEVVFFFDPTTLSVHPQKQQEEPVKIKPKPMPGICFSVNFDPKPTLEVEKLLRRSTKQGLQKTAEMWSKTKLFKDSKCPFLQGYVCAVVVLIREEGLVSSTTKSLFRSGAGNLTIAELVDRGVDESDIEVLRQHESELYSNP